MDFPPNRFKQRLLAGEQLLGLWSTIADPGVAELVAGLGFDWILVDAEHGPFDVPTVNDHLRGIAAAYATNGPRAADLSHPVVRVPNHDPSLVKRYLDLGAQNLMVPMVEDVEQAAQLVRAVRYPPAGIRGIGNSLARSSRWNSFPDYLTAADAQVCLIVQVESRAGVDNAADIAAVAGVDAVLIGAADLAADMGLLGQPRHPDVVAAVSGAIDAVSRQGVPSGVMSLDPASARQWLAHGVTFAGIASDAQLLATAGRRLLEQFHDPHD